MRVLKIGTVNTRCHCVYTLKSRKGSLKHWLFFPPLGKIKSETEEYQQETPTPSERRLYCNFFKNGSHKIHHPYSGMTGGNESQRFISEKEGCLCTEVTNAEVQQT